MQLTVRDVASLLSVAEKQIYEWIQLKDFPAHRVNDQYHFNKAEVLEWVSQRKIASKTTKIKRAAFTNLDESKPGATQLSLAAALEVGGVHTGVSGADRPSALRNVVERLPVSQKAQLADILIARENAGATAVGEGVALPHAHHPVVVALKQPAVALVYLDKPLDLESPDGVPVTTLFVILSPTPRMHLRILSRLAAALRDADFRKVVLRRASRDEILAEARRVDRDIEAEARLGPTTEREIH